MRSLLRTTIRRAAPNEAPPRLAYPGIQPPYTPFECAAFVRLARDQTPTARRGVSAILGLGLGAGLSPGEQRGVTPQHVSEREVASGEFALFVQVTGKNAREVVVRRQYEELIRDALRLHKEARRSASQPLYGSSIKRRGATAATLAKARTASKIGIDIDPFRLRSTWLVACMSADVPLGTLLYASGLRSARTLVDLLPYCPSPRDEDVQQVLRVVRDGAREDEQ